MYTFKPKQKFAKASSVNSKISTKKAVKIFRVIRNKKLTNVRRLLDGLQTRERSIGGKYYTKAVNEIKNLLDSCEKNAEFIGLDKGALFVHASAHQGNTFRRRRRKSAFGSLMKTTHMEIMLIEKGRLPEKKESEKEKRREKKEEKKIGAEKKENVKKPKEEAKKEHKEMKPIASETIGGLV